VPEKEPSLSDQIYLWLHRLREMSVSFLRSLPSLLSKLTAPFKEFADLITNKDDTGKERDSSPKEPSVIANVVPPPPSNEKTKKTIYVHTPWWKTPAEMVGIGAVVLYTYFAHGQWHEMIRAADAAKEAAEAARNSVGIAQQSFDATVTNFHLEQRATLYVIVTADEPPQINKTMDVVVHIVNSGKTFAVNVKLAPLLTGTYDPKFTLPPKPQKFRPLQESDYGPPNIIPPNSAYAHNSTIDNAKNDGRGFGQAEIDGLISGKEVVWMHGEITYDNIFKQPHWLTFCYYRTVSGGHPRFETCKEGNDTDRN